MPSNIRLFAYGSTSLLNILGTITVNVGYNGKQILANFVVVNNRETGCLLDHKSATQLYLLRVANSVSIQSKDIFSNISAQFPKVFKDLKDFTQTIHADQKISAVAQVPRRVPFHVHPRSQT